jgi:H+/Cl- antiporter ClcA
MYTAAICVGCTVAWGNPIGAVILGVELTSTYFMVGTLLKSFLASVIGIAFIN